MRRAFGSWSVPAAAILLIVAVLPTTEAAGLPPQEGEATTRSELWRAWRESKAEGIAPGEPSFLTRYVVRPFGLLVREHGDFRFVLHGGHRQNSPAFGFRWERLALGHRFVRREMPNRMDLRFEASTSADGHNEIEAVLGVNRLWNEPLGVEFTTSFERHPHDSFFGLGPDSRLEDRSAYLLSVVRFGADVLWTPTQAVTLRADGSLLRVRTDHGGDPGLPTIAHVFPAEEMVGFGDTEFFFRTGLEVTVDRRDVPELPRAGTFAMLRVENFADLTESDLDFRRYRAELEHYFPFFHRQQTVVLRGMVTFTDPHGESGRVPFYFMPTLGHGEDLRGFKSFRFRDRHAMLLQAEYRWQAWMGLQMALFVDAGKVFGELRELGFDDLEISHGLGFRFHAVRDLLVRVDIARSDETIRPHLSFSHVF